MPGVRQADIYAGQISKTRRQVLARNFYNNDDADSRISKTYNKSSLSVLVAGKTITDYQMLDDYIHHTTEAFRSYLDTGKLVELCTGCGNYQLLARLMFLDDKLLSALDFALKERLKLLLFKFYNNFFFTFGLLGVKLPYDPVRPSVGWSVS